jgi:hypothetical protein
VLQLKYEIYLISILNTWSLTGRTILEKAGYWGYAFGGYTGLAVPSLFSISSAT